MSYLLLVLIVLFILNKVGRLEKNDDIRWSRKLGNWIVRDNNDSSNRRS